MEKPTWTKPRELKNLKFSLKVIIHLKKDLVMDNIVNV